LNAYTSSWYLNKLFAVYTIRQRKTAFCTNGAKSHNKLFALPRYIDVAQNSEVTFYVATLI
jgi:hypothetical protein